MKIKYLGHASFHVTVSDGTRIQFDPYQPGAYSGAVGYGAFKDPADIVVISHDHADHNYAAGVPGNPEIIKGTNSQTARTIEFRRFPVFHDPNKGAERGQNVITICAVDGVTLCHLGDLGHLISPDDAKKLGEIDVLFIPVGGYFTIDAVDASKVVQTLNPKICIPMHYKTPKANFPIAPLDDFLKGKQNIKRIGSAEVEVSRDVLPNETEIWVLEHAL